MTGAAKPERELIDLVVREVLRRIQPPTETAPDSLVLSESPVTLETLRDRLEGVKRVVVLKKAVVTPAVQDELRGRGVALQRGSEAGDAADISCTIFRVSEGSSGKQNNNSVCTRAKDVSLAQAIEQSKSAVAGGSVVVVFAECVARVVRDANRDRALRATWAGDVAEMEANVTAAEANVLVVNPAKIGDAETRTLIEAFELRAARAR